MGKRPDDIITVNWGSFKGDSVTIPVCMSSPVARGRSLRAQMEAIKPKIKKLRILICDSLDRHNRADPDGIDRAVCIMEGMEWKTKHQGIIQEFYPDVEFLTWERDILKHPSFQRYYDAIQKLCGESDNVEHLRTSMSMFFLQNRKRRFERDVERGKASGKFDFDKALQSSANYLIEELAGDMVYRELFGNVPYVYWGLYVDDIDIFTRESGQSLPFPETLPVASNRHGPSMKVSDLPRETYKEASLKMPKFPRHMIA